MADGLRRLVAASAEGLFHVVNAQTASWYDLAKAAVDQAGLPGKVHAITADQYPVPAARPAFSGLDTTCYQAATGHRLRPWPEALSEYVAGQTWMPSRTGNPVVLMAPFRVGSTSWPFSPSGPKKRDRFVLLARPEALASIRSCRERPAGLREGWSSTS